MRIHDPTGGLSQWVYSFPSGSPLAIVAFPSNMRNGPIFPPTSQWVHAFSHPWVAERGRAVSEYFRGDKARNSYTPVW